MSLTTRILPASEWPLLKGTLLEQTWPHFVPAETRVLVCEDERGAIVGCVSLFQCWHLEGAWVAPTHRKRASVARAVWRAIRGLFDAEAIAEVWTMAVTDESVRLSERLGRARHLDCDHFAVYVGRT